MADNDDTMIPAELDEGVWAVWDGERLYIPYVGGLGSLERAAKTVAEANHGYRAVLLHCFIESLEGCPHDWEHTHSEPNWGAHYECRICGARTP